MPISGLKMIVTFWKPQRQNRGFSRHLMLAGIYQEVFLNRWGAPEIQIHPVALKNDRRCDAEDQETNMSWEVRHSIWIFKREDKILFFTKKRLVSHFKWSNFREKRIIPSDCKEADSQHRAIISEFLNKSGPQSGSTVLRTRERVL
jgi:hypothetical protein